MSYRSALFNLERTLDRVARMQQAGGDGSAIAYGSERIPSMGHSSSIRKKMRGADIPPLHVDMTKGNRLCEWQIQIHFKFRIIALRLASL
jgi:hypothetical protein